MAFDVEAIRREFPILHARARGVDLAYFDSAGSTLRLRSAIERSAQYEQHEVSAVADARGRSPAQQYALARVRVARCLGADADAIVFCRGATEAINLVANSWGEANIGARDEIVVSELEHCANLAPWHALAQRKGAHVRCVPIDASGALDRDAFAASIGARTRLLAITHASNVTGAVPPLPEIVAAARRVGARVLVDGAQAAAHRPIDFSALDADFYVISGHKVYGPSGIGVLVARRELLAQMPPWQLGANAIAGFAPDAIDYAPPPARFEAGSANIAAALGLAVALDWLRGLPSGAVQTHEAALLAQLLDGMRALPRVRLLPAPAERTPIVAFKVEGAASAAVRTALARVGIEVRAGDLAAQALLAHFGVADAVRVSIGVYTTRSDVERLCEALAQLRG